MFKNLRKKKKGFTLIELIIVIAIIAILAAVAVPKFGTVKDNANAKADLANAKTIANAASALLANDEINSNTGATNLVIAKDATGDAGKIVAYLQNVPTPQNGGENFNVIITNGVVTVTNGARPIYPVPVTPAS